MAEARRRPGFLRERVLQMLESASRPLSGLELCEMLRDEGHAITPSIVFRAIRELVASGSIRKIVTARGYVAGDGKAGVTLHCRRCGAVTEVPRPEVHADLDRIAAARGFAVGQRIVEVPGVCGRCRASAPCADAGRAGRP